MSASTNFTQTDNQGHAYETAHMSHFLLDHQDESCTDALLLMHSSFALAKTRVTNYHAAHRQDTVLETCTPLQHLSGIRVLYKKGDTSTCVTQSSVNSPEV